MIFFFSEIFTIIKSSFSLIFFLSSNTLFPILLPISLTVIVILIFSDFLIISVFIPSIYNLQTFISSFAKINSNFEKLNVIFKFEIKAINFSFIGLLSAFPLSVFPFKYLCNSLTVYIFSNLDFSSAVNSFFSSVLLPPKKNEKALAKTFPFFPSKTFFSTLSFVFFIKFNSVGNIIFSSLSF